MAWLHAGPGSSESCALFCGEPDVFHWLELSRQVLPEIKPDANAFRVVPHDEGHLQQRISFFDAVSPCKLHIRHQQLVAALSAYSCLERHEYSGCWCPACYAFPVHQFDSCNHPSAQSHVLGQRPARQERGQTFPERTVVSISEPRGFVDRLELDKRQKRKGARWRYGAQQMVGHDKMQRVVHTV